MYIGNCRIDCFDIILYPQQPVFVRGLLFSCQSVCPSVKFWFLLLILLNNLRNLFIFCINVDIDKMLLLHKNKGLEANFFEVISLCKS